MLTDQSKILPTLIKNARANAQDLECRRRPTSADCCSGSTLPCADGMDYPEEVSKFSSEVKKSARTTASMSTVSPAAASSLTSSCGSHDVDATSMSSVIRHQCDGGYGCSDGTSTSTSTKGGWRVTELLFSKSEEDLRRWRGVTFGNDEDRRKLHSREENLFDLVVAADIVYLTDLWDSMACTFKVRVSPAYVFNIKGDQRICNRDFGSHRGLFGGSADPPPPLPGLIDAGNVEAKR